MTSPHISRTIRVVDSGAGCPSLPIVIGKGAAKAVMWPGNGALYRTFQVIDLQPGDRTIDLCHPSDSAYYIAAGRGNIIDVATGKAQPLSEGAMLHIDRGDNYRFESAADSGMRLIGGPCPADPALYAHLESTLEVS